MSNESDYGVISKEAWESLSCLTQLQVSRLGNNQYTACLLTLKLALKIKRVLAWHVKRQLPPQLFSPILYSWGPPLQSYPAPKDLG